MKQEVTVCILFPISFTSLHKVSLFIFSMMTAFFFFFFFFFWVLTLINLFFGRTQKLLCFLQQVVWWFLISCDSEHCFETRATSWWLEVSGSLKSTDVFMCELFVAPLHKQQSHHHLICHVPSTTWLKCVIVVSQNVCMVLSLLHFFPKTLLI